MAAQEDVMALKFELKCWESVFTRKFERKPTKDDINESAPEIRDSFKKYAKLRKNRKKQIVNYCVLETSINENKNVTKVKSDGGIFGSDLNKKRKKSAVKSKPLKKYDTTTSWRPKLKPMKRPAVVKDETLNDVMKEQVNENEQIKEDVEDAEEPETNANLSIASIVSQNPVRRLPRNGPNHVQRRHSLIRKSHNISFEWIEGCKESLTAHEKKNTSHTPTDRNKTILDQNIPYIEEENLVPKRETSDKNNNSQEKIFHIEELAQNIHKSIGLNSQTVETNNVSVPICQEKRNKDSDLESFGNEAVILDNNKPKKVRKMRRVAKRKPDGDEEQKVEVENGDVDDSSATIKSSTKSEKGKRKREETDEVEDENTKKVKLTKKVANKGKRLVSNNFVKIDLRNKTYVRGVKKTSASALKRRSWRSKTSFEHPKQSGKCFKCGGEGHWAKFCHGKLKRVDPFIKLDTEKQSLEHAALFGNKGGCFDALYTQSNEDGGNKVDTFKGRTKSFTVDEIMPIDPCWPRKPYIVEIKEDDIEPICAPNGDNPSKDAYKKVKSSLKIFGFTEFREGQHEATARVISGLSTLVILATGSGKSLCYQLPAYMYYKERKMITIVVSPLVALMQDQLVGLPSCLPGAALNSNMTKLQQEKVVTKLKEGQIAILLVSPEALVSGSFGTGILPTKSALPPIAFACIDEAHCLSEWSHNFRPSYLKVCKVLREHYQIKCLLGLTATASAKTAKSVNQHLGVHSIRSIIRDPSPIPENLWITASRDNNRDVALVELLQEKPFDDCDSIIVYVTRRNDADRLAVLLRTSLPDFVPKNPKCDNKTKTKGKGRKTAVKPTWWNCEAYHAGLTPTQRRRVQNQFMGGELRIVVATVAFGMGLDKSDVRSVIHYNMPKSFENFVQEIGRAGRDGKPSYCHVFLTDDVTDLCELRRHIYGDTVDRRTIKRFVDMLFPSCECHKLYEQHKSSIIYNEDSCQLESFLQRVDDSDLEMFLSEEFGFEDVSKKENESEMNKIENQDLSKDESNVLGSAIGNIEKEMICTGTALTEQKYVPKNDHSQDSSIHVQTYIENTVRENVVELNISKGNIENNNTNTSDFKVDTCVNDKPECFRDTIVHDKNNKPVESHECNATKSFCLGHRIALPIDQTVKSLDVREEIISTMLAYLELHSKKWLQVFNPLRSFCAIKCYGGSDQFQLLLKKFPPVAIATKRLLKEELRHLEERRQIEFDMVEIADVMCWDILTVVRELKSLQWNMSVALDAPLNRTGKSGIIVETDMLSFHFTTAPGVDAEERDVICDYIFDTVTSQEETRLLQLDGLYSVLKDLSCQHYWQIPSGRRVDHKAREQVRQFFLCDETKQIEYLRTLCTRDTQIHTPARRWNIISGDIRTLFHSYPDENFGARTIARIFQGIESPCYPAIIYGRNRELWRKHLDVDFNELRRFALCEVAKFKSS